MTAAVRPFSLPLADSLDTARGTIDRREGYLLRVESDDGRDGVDSPAVGVGEAAPLPGWTESREACRRALVDSADALDAGADPESVLADLADAPAARHALALAVADLRATREGVPLYRYLGASSRVERVPVNATVGDAGVGETVTAAERAADAGFDCVKLKVGARPLAADVERVEAVSEALPAVELRVDANGAWDRATAQQFLDAAGDRLAYVEQPLPATDLAGLAALSGPVALDETLAEVDFEAALDADPAAVVLKPMALGGPARAVDLAERARNADATPVVTTTIDAAVARAAAVHVAAAIGGDEACGLATGRLLESDLCPDAAPIRDGRAVVPQGDGTGAGDAWEGANRA